MEESPGNTSYFHLLDKRQLAYSFYGDLTCARQNDLFYFHGMHSCRLEAQELDGGAKEMGIRIISIDRPGIGQSTLHASLPVKWILRSWADDVLALANHLGIETFYILGMSAGAAFALACAHLFPASRLAATGLIASVVPTHEVGSYGLTWEQRLSALLLPVLPISWIMAELDKTMVKHTAGGKAANLKGHSPLAKPQYQESALYIEEEHRRMQCLQEAYRTGSEGIARECKALVSDWGFRLGDVKASINVWVGERDQLAPQAVVARMASRLDGSSLQVFQGESHETIIHHRSDQILEGLLSVSEGPAPTRLVHTKARNCCF